MKDMSRPAGGKISQLFFVFAIRRNLPDVGNSVTAQICQKFAVGRPFRVHHAEGILDGIRVHFGQGAGGNFGRPEIQAFVDKFPITYL